MTSPSMDWEKVGRYLAGELSPADASDVRRWLDEHPADAAVVASLDAAIREVRGQHSVDVDAALRKVKARIATDDDLGSHPGGAAAESMSARARRTRYIGLAAAAVLLVAVGVVLQRRAARDTAAEVAAVVHATRVGERKAVRLSDGSQVIIGPASRIVARGREVALEGEAFFRVAHDAGRPFTVRAADAIIRDVGTEFSVHDDAGERVRVVVSEGAVQLSAAHARDSVLLSRGDIGVLLGGRLAAERGAATAEDLAWTQGTLVFRDASFAEVAADLKRWYGVEVRVTDSAISRRHFTGSFTSESASRVLDVLALALGARVDRRGDTAYISATRPIE